MLEALWGGLAAWNLQNDRPLPLLCLWWSMHNMASLQSKAIQLWIIPLKYHLRSCYSVTYTPSPQVLHTVNRTLSWTLLWSVWLCVQVSTLHKNIILLISSYGLGMRLVATWLYYHLARGPPKHPRFMFTCRPARSTVSQCSSAHLSVLNLEVECIPWAWGFHQTTKQRPISTSFPEQTQ